MGALERLDSLAASWRGTNTETLPFDPAPAGLTSGSELSECRFDIAVFPNFTDTTPSEHLADATWQEVIAKVAGERPVVTQNKQSCATFIPCRLKEAPLTGAAWERDIAKGGDGTGVRRSTEHIEHSCAIPVDLDKLPEATVKRLLDRLDAAGIAYLAYSTHSHGVDGAFRCRVVLPLDEPVAPGEFSRLAAVVNQELFDGGADEACERPAQQAAVWSAPRERVDVAFKRQSKESTRPLSVANLWAIPHRRPSRERHPIPNRNADLTAGFLESPLPTAERVREALQWIDPDIYASWIAQLPRLKAWGAETDESAARQLWLEFSERADPDAKRNNTDPQYDPVLMWQGASHSATAGQGAGAILADARDTAIQTAKRDAGKPKWSEAGAAAAAYIAKHHQRYITDLDKAGCPEIPTQGAESRQSAEQSAQQVVNAADAFFDQYGVANSLLRRGRRLDCVPLDSQQARDAFCLMAVRSGQKTPSKEALDRAIQIRRAQAREADRKQRVYVRVGKDGEDYLLDLGDADGNMCRIGEGTWTIEQNDRIAWRRQDGCAALPQPVRHRDACTAWDALDSLWEAAAVPEALRLPVVAAMLEWLRVDTPHPIVEFLGGAGSGKSTAANSIAQLIDPTADGVTPNVELEAEHMCALAQRRHVFLADNLSRISREGQDTACRCATGTSIAVRQLYAQSETVTLPLHRPIIIAAISPVITQPDLLDRALRVPMEARPAYTSGVQLTKQFEIAKPDMLGAVLTLFAEVQGRRRVVGAQRSIWQHRLVDFAQTGEALAQALGNERGYFLEMLTELRKSHAREIAEGDPLASLVRAVLQKACASAVEAEEFPHWRRWGMETEKASVSQPVRGKPTQRKHYAIRYPDGTIEVRARASWLREQVKQLAPVDARHLPESDRAMGGALTRLQPMLRDLGIRVDKIDLDGPKISGWKFVVSLDAFDGEAEI